MEILSWIRTQQSGNIISEIKKAVYLGDEKRLQEALRKYMITSISFYDGAAEEALAQTADKEYQRDLEGRGVSDIYRYGIAFAGKDVEVRMAR